MTFFFILTVFTISFYMWSDYFMLPNIYENIDIQGVINDEKDPYLLFKNGSVVHKGDAFPLLGKKAIAIKIHDDFFMFEFNGKVYKKVISLDKNQQTTSLSKY